MRYAYDIIKRRKHVLRPAIKQTEATIFLFQNGYVLGEDYAEGDRGQPLTDGKSINTTSIVAHLVKAVQELKAENDSLKTRIETLENN